MKRIIIVLSTLIALVSFSNIRTGRPNIKISASVGVSPTISNIGGVLSIGAQPEWTATLSKEWEIGFGPVLDVNTILSDTYDGHKLDPKFGAGLAFRFDAKKRLSNNHKVYIGAETGVKFFNDFYTTSFGSEPVFAINTGVEYKNGFYVGGFVGYGKGVLGLELGYRTL